MSNPTATAAIRWRPTPTTILTLWCSGVALLAVVRWDVSVLARSGTLLVLGSVVLWPLLQRLLTIVAHTSPAHAQSHPVGRELAQALLAPATQQITAAVLVLLRGIAVLLVALALLAWAWPLVGCAVIVVRWVTLAEEVLHG